jgi:hypothetical protein
VILTILEGRIYYPQHSDKETEAQKGYMCDLPKTKLGFKPESVLFLTQPAASTTDALMNSLIMRILAPKCLLHPAQVSKASLGL